MVEVPATPVLVTVAGVELGSSGYWDISNIQGWHPTAEDFAAAVAALDCPAVRRPVLKFGHTGEPGEGDPTIGNVDNLRLTDDGQTLVGDFVGIPAWLAEADDEGRSVLASAYPDRSGEWFHDYVCQLGHTHPFVLKAMALLGVMTPGIGTLESLYDLYTKAPTKEPTMARAGTIAQSGTTADQVRKAYYTAEPDYYLWIREMYVDPPELIVQDDHDDTLLRVPYTITSDGDVEFGEGQAVKVEYVAARAAGEKPAIQFASRKEARPQMSSAAEAEETPEGKEGIMPTLKEGLVQKLGIAADVDDETALQALDEALAERAEDTNVVVNNSVTPSLEQATAAVAAAGLAVVDRAQYDATVAAAQAGAEARAQQLRESDERAVDAAISAGKIAPARRDHHVAAMAADREGHQAVLDSLAPGLIPLAEAGHSKQPADGPVPDDLGWFDSAPTAPSSEGKE
ncbi:phage protease [[Mycobacterium] crassicus]|uniref:Phage protease n=1 Tax=[Mycobacterium] crassicus TaxID=2872309 RepID=A0ABU5XGB0_9MYCO|nr:phage protease [Mycolicibacter sp. MYC098]MEB3021304.1 phage protease [Mycolicibacter sp. MYC098]